VWYHARMISAQGSTKSKILSHLRKLAPFSVVERGIGFATNSQVAECSSSGSLFSGIVREEETTHTVKLSVLSASDIEASCSCCDSVEMAEQWCPHAIALLWRAAELDFFEQRSGFQERESTYRINQNSAADIADTIRELHLQEPESLTLDPAVAMVSTSGYTPKVTILLDLQSDRLGVRILFDEVEQEPTIFESFRRISNRALDNILLQTLEDEGTWDEGSRLWFINSSKGIEIALGLINEYKNVLSIADLKPITTNAEPLGAKVTLSWQKSSLDLAMHWVKADVDGIHEIPRTQEVLGNGPFWTLLGSQIYRLTPRAARIASIFGHSATLSIPRSQVGPILEVLEEFSSATNPTVVVTNPEKQPSIEIKTPVPVLYLERKDVASDHFASFKSIELAATLDFEYPTPTQNANVVFLRDREFETNTLQLMANLGFTATPEKRRYSLIGDAALDFIHETHEQLKGSWKLNGLDAIKKGVRFSDLNITVSLAGSSSAPDDDRGFGEGRSSIDWFDCRISLIQNNANVPLSAVFKNARGDTDRWTRLDSGAYARVPGGNIAQLRTILGMVDPNCRVSNTIKTQLSLAQAISLSRISEDGFSVSLDKRLGALNEKLSSFSEIKTIKAGKGFTGKLRHYQEEGISWLNFLHEFELGGILADEMGLGKTVQALAFFHHLRSKRGKKGSHKPVLIIAPTSVITNWSYEIKRFVPEMTSIMLHGPGRKALFSKIPESDFVLTSYALLRLDRHELERYEFSYVVLDEAQNIKNPAATTTKAAKALRCKNRLALTGTPTENRPMELWSIMDFLLPGYLGSQEFFRNNIERPILEGGTATNVAQMLNAKTRPFILRRLKADVEKELPPKIESVLHVEMTPSQKQLYAQILNEVRPKVFDAVKKKGIQGASVSILAALLRLRQVCNHPNSIDALSELQGYDSGKFNLLKDLTTEALESGRKILLFSQFRGMLSIIRSWLDEVGVNHLYLDGTTRNRQDLIDQFSQDESVRLFLISLKAGGAGLNLMAADTVIIYDPWWNPAVESQAVDRAHRIGQNKTVSVYRLVTEESVEQKIMALKSKKSKLVDALINENGLSTINLSKADLESLFSIDVDPSAGA
jgi:superfamily II DNA or RNA helicase